MKRRIKASTPQLCTRTAVPKKRAKTGKVRPVQWSEAGS